jgi:uncharacterized damage-inducible protein DinB
MIDAPHIHEMYDHLRVAHGVCLRLLEAFPEDALDRPLAPPMRTPKQVAVHLYWSVRGLVEGVRQGALDDFEAAEATALAGVRDKAALLAFCRGEWDRTMAAVSALTDRELQASVATPWGRSMPGYALVRAGNDEFLHHRGQLYVMLRLAGGTPPDMYSGHENAPEFRPKPQAQPA